MHAKPRCLLFLYIFCLAGVPHLGADRILALLFLPRAPLQLGAEAGKLLRERAMHKARMQGHRDLTWACSRTVLDLDDARALSFYGIPKGAPSRTTVLLEPQTGGVQDPPVGFPDDGGVIRDMAPLLTQPFWTMKRSRLNLDFLPVNIRHP